MNDILTIHSHQKPIYDIVFRTSFDDLTKQLSSLSLSNRKICIVTETTVAPHYLEEVQSLLNGISKKTEVFVFSAGEENKNLQVVSQLYTKLIESHFDRNDILVALGGGVVGDLTGFAAATYLRGIDFIQIPTSLLSQVDSSIGGKTGVDFDSYKNMVGAFHQPKLVYINISTLNTLTQREFNSGMGEIIKHGLIKDKQYYNFIMEHKEEIKRRDPLVLLPMIYRSCEIKGKVVENDPLEKGERALLNFGHTLGHSIERLMDFKLLHGECVVIGSLLASIISMNKGYISKEDYLIMAELFNYFDFPSFSSNLSNEEIIAITKLDKKMDSGIIKFILLEHIGEAYTDRSITDQDMMQSLDQYRADRKL